MAVRDESWRQGTPCWVDLSVDDPQRAGEFYAGLFGWQLADSGPDAGGYLMAMLNGRAAAGIGPKPTGVQMPAAWTTYLAADDADDIHAKVVAAGGQPFGDPFDVLDVGRMFVAADPAGAVFGVWQARKHTGFGIYNEPGACTWNEVHTRDYQATKDFYASVFGFGYHEMGDGQQMRYAVFSLPDAKEGESVGGVNDLTLMPGDTPPHWLGWFSVADCDVTVQNASRSGGAVRMPPSDSPVGRMAILAGPEGESFGVIDPSRAQAAGS